MKPIRGGFGPRLARRYAAARLMRVRRPAHPEIPPGLASCCAAVEIARSDSEPITAERSAAAQPCSGCAGLLTRCRRRRPRNTRRPKAGSAVRTARSTSEPITAERSAAAQPCSGCAGLLTRCRRRRPRNTRRPKAGSAVRTARSTSEPITAERSAAAQPCSGCAGLLTRCRRRRPRNTRRPRAGSAPTGAPRSAEATRARRYAAARLMRVRRPAHPEIPPGLASCCAAVEIARSTSEPITAERSAAAQPCSGCAGLLTRCRRRRPRNTRRPKAGSAVQGHTAAGSKPRTWP